MNFSSSVHGQRIAALLLLSRPASGDERRTIPNFFGAGRLRSIAATKVISRHELARIP
jgi:hypothetical protein